jgi:hypothetical protein
MRYRSLPLRFEARSDRAFSARGVAVTTRGISLLGRSAVPLRVRLLGGAIRSLEGSDRLPGSTNYLVGADPAAWRTGISAYGSVCCEEVYPGVALAVCGAGGGLEYDFLLAARADPAVIAVGFDGVERVILDDGGNLLLETAGGTVRQRRPHAFQDGRAVACRYRLDGRRRVRFELGPYDRERPLVIDPELVYSTYLGGAGFDAGRAIAVDAEGNAYVTGGCGPGVAATPGAYQPASVGDADAFVAKFRPDGRLAYFTYLGGSAIDTGLGIAVGSDGGACVTGATTSPDFPGPVGGRGRERFDAFVVKLDADGTDLVHSTILGGTDSDRGIGIAVDAAGSVYVTGDTASPDFPTTPGCLQPAGARGTDAFVARLDAAGQVVYATRLGGTGDDQGLAIAVGATGSPSVTGATASDDFPTTSGCVQGARSGSFDAFVAKLNRSGAQLVYSTYLGGGDTDAGRGIALRDGNVYLAGDTGSEDFPTTRDCLQPETGGGNDAFVAQLDPEGRLVYSTYLGGSAYDRAFGIGVDAEGAAYAAGVTDSHDFPTTPAAIQPQKAASFDGFVAKIAPDGATLLSSTFLGGTGRPPEAGDRLAQYGFDACFGIGVDGEGNAYVTGDTSSDDFPTAAACQPERGGGYDALIAKLRLD